jgi:PAS domain S-box-containing protein
MNNRKAPSLHVPPSRNRDLLNQFMQYVPAPVAMFDREMRYIATSRRFLTDYGLQPQNLVGRSHYEIFPELPASLKEVHQRCLAGATERALEEPFPRKDGRLDWVHWEIHPWYEVNGEIGGIILHSEVITERKLAEEKLREERDKFAKIVATSPGAICIFSLGTDGPSCFPYSTPAIEDICGVAPEQMEHDANSVWLRIHPCDQDRVRSELADSARTGAYWYSEFRYDHPQKGEIWIECRFLPSPQENGSILWYGYILDATHRKQSEELIVKSNQLWNSTFNTISDIVCVISREHEFLKINAAGCNALDLAENQIIGRKCYELLHGATAPVADCPCALSLKTGQGYTNEREENGRFFELSAWPILDETGRAEYTTHIIRDITARKQQELEYKQLIDGMSDAAYVVDHDAKFLAVNETASRTLGYSRAELLKMGPADIDSRYSTDEIMKLIKDGYRDERFVVETQHKAKDGRIMPVEVSASRITYRGQIALLCIARDISERRIAEIEQKKLQAQIIQAQKMESVGRLAGGVAHDYNNILSVILGYTELALEKTTSEDPLHEDLKQIFAAASRSRDITRQLLAFARQETIAPEVLDLNSAVEGILKILRRLIGEDINLAWLPGNNLWPVLMDPTQIDQMLANLCVNARDAISGVGKITIETETVTLDSAFCDSHPGSFPGDYVMFSVADDGGGMDANTLENLFEPFFTTKNVGQGTGLGLATVYGIVKQNNGYIDVSSQPGHGSIFRIYLPRHFAVIAESGKQAEEKAQGGKGETLLLVEDDVAILKLAEKILADRNYKVLSAHTPSEALKIAAAQSNWIDLLITDVVMPQMSGRELSDQIKKIRPGLRCLYMSGYTADVIARRGVLEKDIHYIQKPFSVVDFLAKIRAVLDRP